ncbi:hypothetical protein [Rhodococcus sp. NPDC003348]
MRARFAAIALAAAIALGACGCTVPTESEQATLPARPDAPTWQAEQQVPTLHDPPPVPAPPASSATAAPPPPMAATWTPVPRASGPLPADIEARIGAATAAASARGADTSVTLLDRVTGDRFGTAETDVVETASVAKLFIADEMLHEDASISEEDEDLLVRMLERSDDDAANSLWLRYGGSAIVDAVADRYQLPDTRPPWDGNWWNTETNTADLVDYYAEFLDGGGGLAPDATAEILGHLRRSTPVAADGYDQRFGIPEALGAQQDGDVAVKQGWMCCTAGRWVHVSTAVVGPDSRYVLVVAAHENVDYADATDRGADGGAQEAYPTLPDTSLDSAADDASAAHARETMTLVVRTLFPEGRIG